MTFLIAILARWGLSERAAKIGAYAIVGLAVVALLICLWAFLAARENADDQANQSIGATVEREKAATATIDNAEKANAAADQIKRNTDAARAECLRNARNPANC